MSKHKLLRRNMEDSIKEIQDSELGKSETPFFKSEMDKSRPILNFKQMGIKANPDQDIRSVATPRQKEIAARVQTNEFTKPGFPEDIREMSVKRLKNQIGASRGGYATNTKNAANSKHGGQKGMGWVNQGKYAKAGGKYAVPYNKLTPEGRMSTDKATEGAKVHEAHHKLFHDLSSKIGEDSTKNLLSSYVQKLNPETKKMLIHHLYTKGYGDDSLDNEELVNHIRDIISHPNERHWFHQNNGIKDEAQKREIENHLKSTWNDIYRHAKTFNPKKMDKSELPSLNLLLSESPLSKDLTHHVYRKNEQDIHELHSTDGLIGTMHIKDQAVELAAIHPKFRDQGYGEILHKAAADYYGVEGLYKGVDEKNRPIKGSNKRYQQAKVYGKPSDTKAPKKGALTYKIPDPNGERISPQRMKMMNQIKRKVGQEYGVGLRTAAGKRTPSGAIRDKGVQPPFDVYTPEGHEAEKRYAKEQKELNPKWKRIDPKPDWENPDQTMDTQPNPDAGIHEMAHARQLKIGHSLGQHQDEMDRLQGQLQSKYGFLQNKRTAAEVQPMSMENSIRRELGMPANRSEADEMTSAEWAKHNAERKSKGLPEIEFNKKGVPLTHDTKEPMYHFARDKKGKHAAYMRSSHIMNPENRQRTQDIREGVVKYNPKKQQMEEANSPDALVNLRGQGRALEAQARAKKKFGKNELEKSKKYRGPTDDVRHIPTSKLKQLEQDNYGNASTGFEVSPQAVQDERHSRGTKAGDRLIAKYKSSMIKKPSKPFDPSDFEL